MKRFIDDNVALILAIHGFSPEEIRKFTFRNFFLYEISLVKPSMLEPIDMDGKTYALFSTNAGEMVLRSATDNSKTTRIKIDPLRLDDGIIVGGKWGHVSYARDSRPPKKTYPTI